MRDPTATTAKGASPHKSASRVEDGKVKKLKPSYKSDIPAVQNINGKTYACESCKRGHRVHKCDHGKTRPISETNQPGRPSAGSKRGCQCPRNCACTTKTCKCEKDCACTQEMFLVVRLENPTAVSRESTSTPKPVWEDVDGTQLTLKKVWADANGKEIDDGEYQARQRRMREREDAAKDTPKSSCCGSKQLKDEPESPIGGCRHRQNVAAIQPHPCPPSAAPVPYLQPPLPAAEPWMSTCTCGSSCSCLYCPDHPNNATSINHAQQQVKSLAQQAYMGGNTLTTMPFNSETTSRSCMGGRPAFYLSSNPDLSQHQQFFADTDPNAIYLRYPIQQHSWTNRPMSSHCSHVPSPTNAMTMSPDNHDTFADPLSDLSTPSQLPNDINGIWNFSDSQLGPSSFSWMGLDASYGTDYSIGQATVASVSNAPLPLMSVPANQQMAAFSIAVPPSATPTPLNGFPDLPQLDDSAFIDFDIPRPAHGGIQANLNAPEILPTFNVRPSQGGCCSTSYIDYDLLHDPQADADLNIGDVLRTKSPIWNQV